MAYDLEENGKVDRVRWIIFIGAIRVVRAEGQVKRGLASAYYLWLGLRVAKTTERVRVVNTVTGRW